MSTSRRPLDGHVCVGLFKVLERQALWGSIRVGFAPAKCRAKVLSCCIMVVS